MMQYKNKPFKISFDLFFVLLIFAVILIMFIISLDYSVVARRSPHYVMVPLFLFLIIQIVHELKKFRAEQKASGAVNGNIDLEVKDESPSIVGQKTLELSITAIVLLGLIYLAGQIFGIGIFLILFLRFLSKEKWVLSIILSISVPAMVYVIFYNILNVVLFHGVLLDLIWG